LIDGAAASVNWATALVMAPNALVTRTL
jgi:hypothetical protein